MKNIKFDVEKATQSKEALKGLIAPAPEGGYTIEQVRSGIKVLDKIAASQTETLELEDADYDFVLQRLRSAKWVAADHFVVSFYDAIVNAK